ncbi:MAG: hypothetical protein QOG30_2775 [Acidimicrobiaceae bacterium]
MDHRFAVAAFAIVGVLAACGADAGQPERVDTPTTGRFAITITANGSSRKASLSVSGSFDDERRRVSVVADFSGFVPGLDGPVAMVSTPDAVFVDCPYLVRLLGASTRWIKVTGAGGELVRTSFIDPLRLLDMMDRRDGLVPRTTMRFADGSEEGSALVSLEYFDVGAPVVIEPPAADQVTDETDAVNRLFGGTTGG